MRKLCFVLAATILAYAPPAQTRAQLKRDLKTKESAAKDPDALVGVAKWAKEKGLLTDYKRLLKKVLKKDKNNEAANVLAGNVFFKDKWMPKAKAEALQLKELEVAYKEKGMQKVDGVWVTKAEAADAKKGVFHHDGKLVTRAEKAALMAGKVRHPKTGDFIPAADLDKANGGMFLLGDGRWVDQKEANEYHADTSRPWVLRTHYVTILTNEPLEKFDDLKGVIDGSIDIVKPFFGGKLPHPNYRPLILVCSTTADYRRYGEDVGGDHSVYGAFIAEDIPEIAGIELKYPPVIANWGEKAGWGPYYIRHATGLAYAASMIRQIEGEVPYWIMCGAGSLAERHSSPGDAADFGRQHMAKGGIKDLEEWFNDFQISANLSPQMVAYNVFQAGLVLDYCMRGGDDNATKAVQALTAAFQTDSKAVGKAAQRLQRLMGGKTNALRAYLQKVVQKGS